MYIHPFTMSCTYTHSRCHVQIVMYMYAHSWMHNMNHTSCIHIDGRQHPPDEGWLRHNYRKRQGFNIESWLLDASCLQLLFLPFLHSFLRSPLACVCEDTFRDSARGSGHRYVLSLSLSFVLCISSLKCLAFFRFSLFGFAWSLRNMLLDMYRRTRLGCEGSEFLVPDSEQHLGPDAEFNRHQFREMVHRLSDAA